MNVISGSKNLIHHISGSNNFNLLFYFQILFSYPTLFEKKNGYFIEIEKLGNININNHPKI